MFLPLTSYNQSKKFMWVYYVNVHLSMCTKMVHKKGIKSGHFFLKLAKLELGGVILDTCIQNLKMPKEQEL